MGASRGGEDFTGFGRRVFDAIGALVMVVDPQGRIVDTNRMLERLSGYSREEMLGRVAWEVSEPEDGWDGTAEGFSRILEQNRPPTPQDRPLHVRGGGQRTIRWTAAPIRDERGAVRLIVWTGVDVTELRRATRAQQDQLHFLQTLIDAIPNPIFHKAADGRYLGCNQAFAAMMGLPREHIVGRDVFDLAPPALAERYAAADDALFRAGGVQVYESQVRFADGTVHDVIFSKATWSDSAGVLQGLVGVILDITDRKRAEQALAEAHAELEVRVRARTAELEALKEAAEAGDRSKSEFLNIASHELRTPLTALRITLQRAQRDLAKGRPVEADALGRMERYANRLVRLAIDLVEASRLERGLLVIQPACRDLGELLRAVVEDAAALAPGRTIELQLPDEPLEAEVDADRLAQVLANLIDNAVKYAPPESPVDVQAVREGAVVRITVSDRGPGIPAAAQDRLFSRFYRLPSAMHQPGLGLGLNISREIVQRHGGTLIYEAREGGGSRFVVELPVTPALPVV